MIKKMTISDIPQILVLRFKMLKENQVEHHLSPRWKEITYKYYKKMYQSKKGLHFGYYEDNKLIGIAGGLIKEDFPFIALNCGNFGWIMDVFTEHAYRRKGIARTLTKAIIDWFIQNGVTFIKLDASKYAKKLYKEMGFSHTGEMKMIIPKI